MGILIVGLLVAWALLAVLVGVLVSFIVKKMSPTGTINAGVLHWTITVIFGVAPFLFWNYRIASLGKLWVEECENRTRYILHATPPLDYVSRGSASSSWGEGNWLALAKTDIRSIVARDKKGTGLVGEEGTYLLTLAEQGDPRCGPFESTVKRLRWKTPYLQGSCVAIEPWDAEDGIVRVGQVFATSNILHKSGSLLVRENHTLLKNLKTQEIYAEFISVAYQTPKLTDNLFVLFAWPPHCEKEDALEQANLSNNLFYFAFSSEFRERLQKLDESLQL